MKKQLLNSGVLLAALWLAGAVAAQSPVALNTRQAELRALSAALYQRDLQDRQAVQAYARRLGIAVRRELPGGRVLELQRLLPGPLLSQRPVFYITNNIVAANTVSTDEVWPGGSAGLDLDGGGMSVAQWDGGAVFAGHPDFAGRLTQVDGASIVSGTLGDFSRPQAGGVAEAQAMPAEPALEDVFVQMVGQTKRLKAECRDR